MRLLLSVSLIYFIVCPFVFAAPEPPAITGETWLCGTPLLYQEHLAQHVPEEVAAAPAAHIQIGQTDRFFIHIPDAEVTATCIAKSQHLYVYIEDSVRGMLTEAEAIAIAREFDTRIYPNVRSWMGTEWKPGLDRDNRITLLMHDVGMNESGLEYGGYFAPADQLPTAPNSNRREMLYMDIFQFKERPRHTFYSSLAHEFAHLVNWFQNGGRTDQRWLEEGTASFVEWAVYGTVHTIFVDGYLRDPSVSLASANTWDVYYGGAFMLMLYLYEQYGGRELIRDIVGTDTLGEGAINTALAGSGRSERFPDVFLNWGLANWLNVQAQNRKLGYDALRNRRVTASVPRVFTYPNAANSVPIEQWGAYYIHFENLPQTLDISITGTGSGYLYATTLYLPSNGRPIVTPITFDSRNRGHIQHEGLQPNDEIILMVTADTPQTFSYTAANTLDDFVIGIPRESRSDTAPDSISAALGNRTQPSLLPTGFRPKTQLEPMTQIHLASNYTDLTIHEKDVPHLYAASTWGLEIFSLTEPTKPVRIGEIGTPGQAHVVAIDGDTAYIADGVAGVHVIDVSVPTVPNIVKTLGGFTNARSVKTDGDNLYVLGTARGLLVYNQNEVRNSQTPRPRRFFRTAGTPLNVVIRDKTVYVSDDRHGLYILDQSPFGDFVLQSTVPILANAYEIVESADDAYAFVASGNLTWVDITDAENPEIGIRLNTPGFATSIQLRNNIVYLADQQAGLHMIDVRNPQQPRRISSQPTIGNATDAVVWNTLAYVADGKGGIQTIDVSRPESPKWLHRYAFSGTASGIDVVEAEDGKRTVYVANGTGGLHTLEFTTPYQGILTQNLLFPTENPTFHEPFETANCTKVRVQNGYGFVAADTGMFIVHLDTDRVVAHIRTAAPVYDIAMHDGYAYLCAESLIIVDTRAPQQSGIVSERRVPGSAYRVAIDAAASSAYVAALDGGLHIFDIAEPAVPRSIGSYATQGNAIGVTFAEDRVYLLESGIGVAVLDVSENHEPRLHGTYENDVLPIAAQVTGNYLYLLDSRGVQMIDTRTLKMTSSLVYQNRELWFPSELRLADAALYIADLYQLRILRVHPEGTSLAVEKRIPSDWTSNVPNLAPVNSLYQNYPNPFNPETWIPYQLASNVNVSLHIYDAQGRSIYTKSLGYRKSGSHSAYWDGRNAAGEPVASGVYFYSIQAGDFQATRKMLIRR